MSLPTFVAAGTFAGNIGNITPGLPAGWAENDLFLAFIETDDQPVSAPSGWSEIAMANFGASTRLQVFARYATSSESAPTFVDAGDHQCGAILAFRGVGRENGYSIGGGWNAGSDATAEIPTVTTVANDALVLMCVAHGADADGARFTSWTNANLANITELLDNGTSQGNGGGVGVASGEKATAGATGTSVAALTATAWAAIHVVLYPPRVDVPFLAPGTTVYTPILQKDEIEPPFISAATTVYTPTLDSAFTRATQAVVESVHRPTSQAARATQSVVEVVVLKIDPFARTTQMAVEVVRRNQHDMVQVIWHDEV